ncbi:hypothetical protein AOQ84DRAFT_130776 [Glonium stellatum]|uniref:Uncharacterized protein n=1 Tax=Glonium stellatum TaxID=574774 RepID=A0A8E2FAN1_9PEZI|nr:hypothetical protein AOQ84DRAFT_130776 [Glonium stellatum]
MGSRPAMHLCGAFSLSFISPTMDIQYFFFRSHHELGAGAVCAAFACGWALSLAIIALEKFA